MNNRTRLALSILTCLANASIAFVLGRMTAPPKLPEPNHVWIGFQPETRRAYYVNNGNNFVLGPFGYSVRHGTDHLRHWQITFEESTTSK